MSENTDNIVAKFQTLGTDDIEDQAGARNIIIEVCKAYPDKHFLQREFKDNLASHQHDGKEGFSNPYIHSILKKLVDDGVLMKTKNGRNAYYRWSAE